MGTNYKGATKEINSLNVYIKLLRASDSLRSRMNSLIQENGLTESQFNLLDTLHHIGPLSQSELGKKLFKSGGNITMVVDNLEKRNLVKRKKDNSDRRLFTVHLTANGENLIRELFPKLLPALVKAVNVLTAKEQAELQRLCKALGTQKSEEK